MAPRVLVKVLPFHQMLLPLRNSFFLIKTCRLPWAFWPINSHGAAKINKIALFGMAGLWRFTIQWRGINRNGGRKIHWWKPKEWERSLGVRQDGIMLTEDSDSGFRQHPRYLALSLWGVIPGCITGRALEPIGGVAGIRIYWDDRKSTQHGARHVANVQ